MRYMIPLLLALCAVPCYSSALPVTTGQGIPVVTTSQIPRAKSDVNDVFTRVIEKREKAFAETKLNVRPIAKDEPTWLQPGAQGQVWEADLMILAIKATDPEANKIDRAIFRSAILDELKSDNPKIRGLACQVLSVIFDPYLIEALGGLIDDKAQAVPVLNYGFPQTGPCQYSWTQPTVGEMARISFYSLTSMNFRTKSDFDIWWKTSRNYKDKLWYWAAKWSSPHMQPQILERSNPPSWFSNSWTNELTKDLQTLSKLRDDTGLKILLLYNIQSARQAEAARALGVENGDIYQHISLTTTGQFAKGGDNITTTAEYVNKHHLKTRLIELLQGKNVYAEATGEGYNRLVSKILHLGNQVFTEEDEPTILAVEKRLTKDLRPSCIIARSRIAPKRGLSILSAGIREYPNYYYLAQEMLKRYGAADTDALKKCFVISSDYDQREIADALERAATSGLPVPNSFIADLAEMLEEPTKPRTYASAEALVHLSKAANFNAKSIGGIISDEELASITPRLYKIDPTGERKAHNSKIPEGFKVVRSKLLAKLRSLKSED